MASVTQRRCLVLVALSFCAAIWTGQAYAQSASGIAGVVRDSSGGVLPGVTVEAASPRAHRGHSQPP